MILTGPGHTHNEKYELTLANRYLELINRLAIKDIILERDASNLVMLMVSSHGPLHLNHPRPISEVRKIFLCKWADFLYRFRENGAGWGYWLLQFAPPPPPP